MTRRLTPAMTLSLALLAAPAWADDPPRPDPQPAPVAAVAVLAGPDRADVGGQVFLDVGGTVSADEAELELAEGPAKVTIGTLYDRKGGMAYGTVRLPVAGTYRFALIATGRGPGNPPRAYAFKAVVAGTATPTPRPTDPTIPPGPGPTPATPDPLGLVAFTRATLAATGWTADQARPGATTLAAIFASQAAASGSYAGPQEFNAATAKACKAALGDAGHATWYRYFLGPVAARLAELNAAGKIRTSADLAEAFAEIAAALREVAP